MVNKACADAKEVWSVCESTEVLIRKEWNGLKIDSDQQYTNRKLDVCELNLFISCKELGYKRLSWKISGCMAFMTHWPTSTDMKDASIVLKNVKRSISGRRGVIDININSSAVASFAYNPFIQQ